MAVDKIGTPVETGCQESVPCGDETVSPRKCRKADRPADEQRFRQVVENAPEAIFIRNRDRFSYANRAAIALFGASSASDLLGLSVIDRIHPDDRDVVAVRMSLVNDHRNSTQALEQKMLRLDGSPVDVEVSAVPFRYGHEDGALVFVRDITERKRAEEAIRTSEAKLAKSRRKLRDLAAHNVCRLEQERRSIAREVHDELGQLLTALKMECAQLRRQYSGDRQLQNKIETMSGLLDSTLSVVRHVVTNLRPPALDYGIIPAIEWLAEDFSLRWEIPCELQLDADDILLDDARATALFRIIQESLTNVARHAEAGKVAISLRRQGEDMQLCIWDNGRGFDPAVVSKKPGFGLQGMRERAITFDGRMRVTSTPGVGTAVTVEIPL